MEAVQRLRRSELRPIELVEAALARIVEVDPAVNAMPTLCAERARERARRLERTPSAEGSGWLGGLPIAVKDLTPVAGVRTTFGWPIYADHVPDRSDLLVECLEARGATVLGKSNTPEFGAGANTFNPVFGQTLNPWDTRMSCAGSSGGSNAAFSKKTSSGTSSRGLRKRRSGSARRSAREGASSRAWPSSSRATTCCSGGGTRLRRPYADRAEAVRRACSFLTEHANLPRERELRSCFATARRD